MYNEKLGRAVVHILIDTELQTPNDQQDRDTHQIGAPPPLRMRAHTYAGTRSTPKIPFCRMAHPMFPFENSSPKERDTAVML
jgi:hypothetical protein